MRRVVTSWRTQEGGSETNTGARQKHQSNLHPRITKDSGNGGAGYLWTNGLGASQGRSKQSGVRLHTKKSL